MTVDYGYQFAAHMAWLTGWRSLLRQRPDGCTYHELRQHGLNGLNPLRAGMRAGWLACDLNPGLHVTYRVVLPD